MWDLEFSIMEGGENSCTPDWGRAETPDYHRLYFPYRGEARIERGGHSHRLRSGQVLLIPGYQPVQQACAKRMDLYWLHFRANELVADATIGTLPRMIRWTTRQWAPWRGVYTTVAEYLDRPTSAWMARCQSMLLYHVGPLVSRELESTPHTDTYRRATQLQPAIVYMDRHFARHPSIEEVSRQVDLSSRHFHRRFRDLFHITPHQYQERKRMRLAFTLLAYEGLTVAQAAHRTGYNDPYYFSRAFRRFFGYPPSEAHAQEHRTAP